MDEDNKDLNQEGSEIEAIQAQRDQYLDALKRERADFLNYKKTVADRIEAEAARGSELIVRSVIDKLDELALAIEHAPPGVREDKQWFSGLMAVSRGLEESLKKFGAEKIEGEEFDPEIHEAISIEEGDEDRMQIVKAGWKLKDKVIRPAIVKIIKKKD